MNEFPGNPGPFDKDVIEKKNVLSEKDFIQEKRPLPGDSGSFPVLIWVALLAMVIALLWGSAGWFQGLLKQEVKSSPFLEVTNRQFSAFLWQYPIFMRANAKNKTGYLPGFQYVEKQTLYLDKTEEVVNAPPEILFVYHTWSRLISSEYIARPISPTEFVEFLNQVPEWSPNNWKEAPEGYVKLIVTKGYEDIKDLQTLPETTLPIIVRQSFIGWKNYFKEGPAINQLMPTFKQVEDFLEKHPHYARNYWRNITEVLGYEVAGSKYLIGLLGVVKPDESVPVEQLAPFLKVALYNAQQAKEEK